MSTLQEMTVKGLEPELHNMIEQHQQEIQELRRVHIKELQDVELRAMRRSNQQLEQLRIELTDSHENLLTKEKDILIARFGHVLYIKVMLYQHHVIYKIEYTRLLYNMKLYLARYKEKLEEQETHFQTQQKTLAEHFEKEKSILIAEQKKRDEETSAMMQQTHVHFQVC